MKGDMRQLALPGYELADYVKESITFLRQYEPQEGYFVGFSGGKDSIVSLELCRIAGVKHKAFYSCTRIDPPEDVRFIRQNYPDVKWLFPKESLFALIRKHGPPFRSRRWCCDHLKKIPSKDHPLKSRIMGIRAEESKRRASRPRIDTFNRQTTYKVIFNWPEWAVWEFIEERNIVYPALYDEGFHRIGCVVCPYILGLAPGAVRQRERGMSRWPGIWKAYELSVKNWWTTTTTQSGQRRRAKPGETAEDYWQAYLNGFEQVKHATDRTNLPCHTLH